MDASRQQRVARNEAAHREINEAMTGGQLERGERERLMLVCECADVDCAEPLLVTVEQYEAVRANPRRFLIAPGHEVRGAEEVVERHPGFDTVEKVERGAEVAEDLDPRSDGA